MKASELRSVLIDEGYSSKAICDFFKEMKSCDYDLSKFSDDLRAIYSVVLWTVKYNGFALEYAGCELNNDSDIALAAVLEDGMALKFVSERLRGDKNIVMTAVLKRGSALQFANTIMLNDRDVVLAAVKSNGYALKYASEELRADKEIVLAAVSNSKSTSGVALSYASDNLKDDPDVVFAALLHEKNKGVLSDNIRYASKKLQDLIGTQDPLEVLGSIVSKTNLSYTIMKCSGLKNRVKI